MRIDSDPKLDFDDVLIRPKRSEAPSRSAINLEREHRFLNSGATWKGVPIVASNMDTVGTMAMAKALGISEADVQSERFVRFFSGDQAQIPGLNSWATPYALSM